MKSLLLSFLILISSLTMVKASDFVSILDQLNNTEEEISSIYLEENQLNENIDTNIKSFNELIAVFNKFKTYDIEFAQRLAIKVKNHDTLNGAEVFFLRRLITTYYKINQKFLDFAKMYDLGGLKMSANFYDMDKNAILIKAHLVWLSGHLLVLDHLEEMHTIFYETDDKFRRIVKSALLDNGEDDEDSKTLNDVIKINKYAVNIGESKKFSKKVNLIRGISTDLIEFFKDDKNVLNLINEINNNPTSIKMAQGKVKFHEDTFTFIDSVYNAVTKTIGWLSSVFGNWAGSIHTRKGHFYNNSEAIKLAEENLKPMDIILDKSPFILTDKFIPGYFGHVAIYLGTKKQLLEIGMWNHPDILPYQEKIESGHIILEAVREGVRLGTLENFMNIDELLVIRKNDVLDNQTLLFDKINRGINQIGKNYDFNFDVSTLDSIVCSELIYIVFGNVHWPTQYRFGRPTISPDNIAEIVFHKNTKFNTELFLLSTNDKEFTSANIETLAYNMEYELRASDAGDENKSYWKKTTKCHTVSSVNPKNITYKKSKKICETTYSEYSYEEFLN